MKLRLILTLVALLLIIGIYVVEEANSPSTPSDSGGVVVQQ